MSEEQEFKLDLPLCYLFRYFVQVWAGLKPVRESCSEVKLPLLGCKCTLGAAFCLPELSWLCSKGGGDTNSIAQQNNKRGRRPTFTDEQLLPATPL